MERGVGYEKKKRSMLLKGHSTFQKLNDLFHFEGGRRLDPPTAGLAA
jgi:hypothetical protein